MKKDGEKELLRLAQLWTRIEGTGVGGYRRARVVWLDNKRTTPSHPSPLACPPETAPTHLQGREDVRQSAEDDEFLESLALPAPSDTLHARTL